jgi:hypothetical protein
MLQNSPLKDELKLFFSHEGKREVVNGALADRVNFDIKFVRNFTTQKSYGSLLSVTEHEMSLFFPNIDYENIGIKVELACGDFYLVIDWAIPAVSLIIRTSFH